MIEVVSGHDDRIWTIAVVRGNQWQSWDWMRRLDRVMDRDGSAGAITLIAMVLQLPAVAPVVVAWLGYRIRHRQDVRLTVREGTHSASDARRNAVVDDYYPSKGAALERVPDLVAALRRGRGVGQD